MIIFAPLLAAVIGALGYALAANPKLSELSRITFACGVLVFLFLISTTKLTFP
jgi:hypothetical protein